VDRNIQGGRRDGARRSKGCPFWLTRSLHIRASKDVCLCCGRLKPENWGARGRAGRATIDGDLCRLKVGGIVRGKK
jgi:hypothetical protein